MIRIGHTFARNITWTVSGAGAAILSPASQLTDDRPDTVTAFQWLSGVQTLASVFHLRADWTTPITPGFVALLNLRLPVGTKTQVTFRRAGDAAGTYPYAPIALNPSQRIFGGPRGERTAITAFASGLTPVIGADIQVVNDVNGAAAIAAGTNFWLGEAIICAGSMIDIEAEWTLTPVDSTTAKWSTTSQPFRAPGTIQHQLAFRLPADAGGNYYGNPNDPAAIDYESLVAKLDRGRAALYCTRSIDDGGAFSAHMLHRTTKLGVMTKLPAPTHRMGPYFDSSAVTVMEVPIPT